MLMKRMIRAAAALVAVAVLAGGGLWAQEAPDAAAEAGAATQAVRQKAAALQYAAERFRMINQRDEIVTTLKNGMTVIVKRVPSPVLTVRGYVQTGGIYEGRWLGGGLSHLLEHLVAGGSTEKRSEAENRSLLQALGNNSNAYTTTDHTAYFINTTPENMVGAVDLLTDWLLGAKITHEEYAREYQVVQRELEKGRGEPGRQFYYLSQMNRYRVSPARVPVIGYQEVIQGLSRDDVYAYYKLAYVPNNMILTVVGDVDPEQALATIQQHVDVPAGREFLRDIPDEPPVLTPRTVVATFPKLGQANLELSFPSIRLQHEDLYALDMLANVMGDGESSILTEEVRDRLQLVSGIGAGNYTPHYVDGTFDITMRLDPDKIDAATKAVLEIIERIKTEGVSEERLERARTRVRTGRIRGSQTSEQIAASMARDLISSGDPHFTDRYVERIMDVTAEQVQAMARKYLDTSRLITTALLPAEYVGADGLPRAEELLRQATPTTPDAAAATDSDITRIELDNGTILLHKRITTTPLVQVSLYALGGLTRETAETNGIGQLTMNLLPRGTKTRTAQEIAAFFDSIGGSLNTGMGNNSWYWTASFLNEDFERAFEVYADVVNNPAFPEDELVPLKARTLAAIASQDASWEQQAFRFFREKYYGPRQSPYQFQSIGRAENVESFTAGQLAEWYRREILPSRRVLAIFGDIDLATAQRLAAEHFGKGDKIATETPVNEAPPAVAPEGDVPAVIVERVETQQTQQPLAGVVIGFESNSVIGDETNYAIGVADTMTSGYGYPTGYLHETLRGRGLVYVVHAMNSPGKGKDQPGTFLVYAGCDPRRVNEVVEAILMNIARLQGSEEDMVTGWFERSRQLMLTSEAMDRETAADQATTAALNELYGLGYAHHLLFPEKLKAVTLDDVRQVARQRLSKAVVTISTPAPDLVKIETGRRTYERFEPVDLTPKGVEHDAAGSAH